MKGGLVVARKIEFDKAASLQKAMRVFWRQGYETTSVQDLVDELGLIDLASIILLAIKKHYF